MPTIHRELEGKPKWTPGPWTAEWDDRGQWYVEPLGVTGTKLRGDSGECVESANAQLIAAAPDLYEALDWALGVIEICEQNSPNIDWSVGHFGRKRLARAALAKAIGES